MNPNYRPFISMPVIGAGLMLVIGLVLTGLAPGSGEGPLPAGAASAGRTPAARPLATNTPVPGTWSATGSLNTSRVWHTATLLPNGQALVAGGQDSIGNFLSSTELYDLAAGVWTYTGSLHTGRAYHTATLLSDGQVLVAGGEGIGGAVLTSAELYDPDTGTWTPTGSLNTARHSHTATLLSNGQIIVAGGEDNNGLPLASAELYDPATGTWTYTGSLNAARYLHTGTLLTNGRVLIAGGCCDISGLALASAELYNKSWIIFRKGYAASVGVTCNSTFSRPRTTVSVAG